MQLILGTVGYESIIYNLDCLSDIVKFCCHRNEYLCMDTTFKLANNLWVTTLAYQNQRIEYIEEKHPWWLAAAFFHIKIDEDTFKQFLGELLIDNPDLKGLNYHGTDQGRAMYNGSKELFDDVVYALTIYGSIKKINFKV